MFTELFKPNRKRLRPLGLSDSLGLSLPGRRAAPCELWSEYGIARIAEIKLQRPSPLAKLLVEKAQT